MDKQFSHGVGPGRDGPIEQPQVVVVGHGGDLERILAEAVQRISEGIALFDQEDRLVFCNDRFRDLHELSASAIVPGTRFEDFLRHGLAQGQYVSAIGRETDWLAERVNARQQAESSIEVQLSGGRWLRVVEQAEPGGGRVELCFDITPVKAQERRLASIVAAANLGTWEWNVQTSEFQLNRRCAEMLGYSPAELAPVTIDTIRRLCHPDDLAVSEERLARHLRGAASFHEAELRLRHAAGHWVWVLSRARVASWTTDGRPEWVSGTHLDISDRMRQQLEAIAVQRRLEATLQAIPDQLLELDREGRILDYHTASPELAMAAVETFIGRTIGEILPPEVAAIQLAALGEAQKTGRSTGRQYMLRMNDREHWFELSVALKPVEHDASPTFIVLARNITRHKELERSLASERDFFDQIMAANLTAVVVIDAAGRLTFVNRAFERISGESTADLLGRRFDDASGGITMVDGGQFPAEALPFTRVMATDRPVVDVRLAFERPDGERRVICVNAAPLSAMPGGDRRVVCSIADITETIAAEMALVHQSALMRGLFELCPLGISLTDFGRGAFIDMNEALLAATGFSREEIMRRTVWDLTPEAHWRQEIVHLAALVQSGRYGPFEKEHIRKDGSHFPVLVRGSLITDLTGRKLIWSIVEDITERKVAEAQIVHQAQYDELTGLPNRRLFQERLAGALERARRGRHIGAVAMLDLDDFKTVNDGLGHRAGDAVLVEAAARLTACTRATDTVARFGGDEFLVLLDDIVAPGDAAHIADKIQAALARPYRIEEKEARLGVSIGICLFPADSTDIDELIRLADMAMYRAKRLGRNLTRFHATTD